MRAWLDSHSTLHSGLGWLLLGTVFLAAFAPVLASLRAPQAAERVRRLVPGWAFFTLLVLAVLVQRWPIFLFADELNPDESQLIAGALTLKRDWFYWSVVDGTTHGPVNVYPLALAHLVGVPLNYFGARLVGTLSLLAGIFAMYRAARAMAGDSLARVGVLPAACFVALATFWDFVHLSSEHVPATLLMIGAALLVLDRERGEVKVLSIRWIVAGVLLGAVPLAKLQGGPVMALLLIFAALLELSRRDTPWPLRFKRVGVLALAAVTVPLGFVLVSWVRGAWPDVWESYWVQNIVYAATRHHQPLEMLHRFWEYARIGPEYYPYALGGAMFIIATVLRVPAFRGGVQVQVWGALLMLAASLAVTIAPGRQYSHYLLWLVLPLGWAVAALLTGWWEAEESPLRRLLLLAVFCGALILPQVLQRAGESHPYLGRLAASTQDSAVVAELRRHAQPGETLGMWGWNSRLYVKTQLVQATRDAHSYLQTAYNPQIDYYRARYLKELFSKPPPVFVDAVGPGNFVFEDRTYAHESFPPLAEFLAKEYRLVADVDGARVYVRADRLPAEAR